MQNPLNHSLNSRVMYSIISHYSFIISTTVNIATFLSNQFLDGGGVLRAIVKLVLKFLCVSMVVCDLTSDILCKITGL